MYVSYFLINCPVQGICIIFSQSIEELEKEMLNGQKLQGPATSAEVYHILKQKGLVDKSVYSSVFLLIGFCLTLGILVLY